MTAFIRNRNMRLALKKKQDCLLIKLCRRNKKHFSFSPKMDAAVSPETWAQCHQTTRRQVPEDSDLEFCLLFNREANLRLFTADCLDD